MPAPLDYKSVRTTKEYDALLKGLYGKAKRTPEEVMVPSVRAITVSGNEPPGSQQYAEAIGVLYGIGYGLKMGLKFGKLPKPAGYFDYGVGALGTFWWSTGKTVDVRNAKTLRWQAYLMVPAFVSKKLFNDARAQAQAKHPDTPWEKASLETLKEGRSVQILHIGPYDKEAPTIATLHEYVAGHGLALTGRHHEIYLSDPRRTKPAALKTVIRNAVKRAGAARR